MLEQVENKIEELKKLQTEEYYRKKDEDLQAWGLTYKKDGKKVTPIIVTDEEYEALIKASNGVGASGRNSYAKSLRFLAFVVIGVGIVAGIVAALLAESLSLIYFSVCIVIGLVLSAIFFGLSEAIRLLQQIVDDKPNEKPADIERKEAKAKAKQAAPSQQTAYQQVPYQPIYQQPVYQPGQQVYQQPPVYIYQQPVSTQPNDSGIHYGDSTNQ